MRIKNVREFVEKKLQSKEVVHIHEIRPSNGKYAQLEHEIDPALKIALSQMGIDEFYTHQAGAIDAVLERRSVVISTSTSSGKSICYLVPILQKSLDEPQATSLLMFPTKALAQDQLRTIEEFRRIEASFPFQAGTYDGDTPVDLRRTLRNTGTLILTNPDMLHQGILPNHFRWTRFFSNLKYVVIDEIHTYRGIFGSNVANVIRRLRRICLSYGSDPVFICCSATINNPKQLADTLTGKETALSDNDGSPNGPKQFALLNPGLIDETGLVRVSPISMARRLMADLIKERIQTITFSRTRRTAEIIFRYCQEELQKEGPSLAKAVRAYRGGYLPEERREIEQGLASGDLLGVSSTNALELGINIGGLDASLIVSYPGTIASLWQQAGRSGRGEDPSLAVLIAQNSPIDQFLMKNPKYLFEQSPENAVIDPDNPELAIWHLICALYELPINEDEMNLFGKHTAAMLDMLINEELAKASEGRWNLVKGADDYPAANISLRSMNNVVYTIIEEGPQNRVIGTVDESTAFTQIHTNAVYLHDAETYIVTMFKKVKFHTSESLGYENLTLPSQLLETTAFWLVSNAAAFNRVKQAGRLPEEGLFGIANVLVNVMSLYTMCDIMDIGAVVDSSNLGKHTIFIYDYYPGGIGFAARGFKMIDEIMEATLKVIEECECRDGCPSCVGAAAQAYMKPIDSITRDQIPDKHAALIFLHTMMELPDYIPPVPAETGKSSAKVRLSVLNHLPPRTEKKIYRRLRGSDEDEET